MKKRLGVLLLRIEGFEDLPTKDYADRLFTAAGRGTGNLVDYYSDMSHGNLDLGESRVFEWINYGHTLQDLTDVKTNAKNEKKKELLDNDVPEQKAEDAANVHANLTMRTTIKQWAKDAAAQNSIDLSGYDVMVCVFNTGVDYFGSPGEVVLNWNPNHTSFSVDLTGVAHEIGHGLGLNHSRMEGSDSEYGDRWDIMSAYVVDNDSSGTLVPPGTSYFTAGPGLNAVNMDLAGWLDTTRVLETSNSTTFRLRPLHRKDLPGYLAAKLTLGNEQVYVEFRFNERWDAGITQPGVVLHRKTVHPSNGSACSELMIAVDDIVNGSSTVLLEGQSFEMGEPNPISFGYYARLTVASIDRENREARIHLHVREPRMFEPSGTLYGGVTTGGGGLMWTPGRGFVKVPPRSPLIKILSYLTEYEILQSLDLNQEPGQRHGLNRLVNARDQLTAIIDAYTSPKVPAKQRQ